jgi:type II secretory pathway pseudopilin PulG
LQILALLILCVFVLWRVLLYYEIKGRFTRIRAAGLPTSGFELNTWRRPVADADNGALVLAQAFALMQTFQDSRFNEVARPKLILRTNGWSSETHSLVTAYVQTNAQALAKAREAMRFPLFRYPVDYSYGPDTEMPHLRDLKKLAHIVALRAVLDAEDGRSNEWPAQVEFQLQLAATLDGEPALYSHLARGTMIHKAVQATERNLNRDRPGDEECSKLQAAFFQAGETNGLPLALAGERAMMAPVFRLSWEEIQSSSHNAEQADQPRKPHRYLGKPSFLLWLSGFLERDLNFFLQTMEKSISFAELAPPRSLEITNWFETVEVVTDKRYFFLTGILLPPISRSVQREASTQAQIRLATTALAIDRFRLDRGRLPADLKELMPQFLQEIPKDPFDGASLRYKSLARGYVIYSVDTDGHDDGGREPPEYKKPSDTNSYDITFTVER